MNWKCLFGHSWDYMWRSHTGIFPHPVHGEIKNKVDVKFRVCSCGKIQYLQPRPYGKWKDGTSLINRDLVHYKIAGSINGIPAQFYTTLE